MKCYLHIGTEKTGSTSLQLFLSQNRAQLNRLGMLYPMATGKIDSRKLSVAAMNLTRADDYIDIKGLTESKHLLRFQKNVTRDLAKEVKAAKPESIIFSSEHIQSRLTSEEELIRLKQLLTMIGCTQFKIIVYLRRPADLANSLFSTAIKSGAIYNSPQPPSTHYYNNLCNHKNTIQLFQKVFGEFTVYPRLFTSKDLIKGSVIEDLCQTIGINNSDEFEQVGESNASLSKFGLEILRRMNRSLPRFIDGRPNRERRNIHEFFEDNFQSSKYLMSQALFDEYELYFEESNEWVRRQFFPERPSLFEAREQTNDSSNSWTENDLDDVSSLILDIWLRPNS